MNTHIITAAQAKLYFGHDAAIKLRFMTEDNHTAVVVEIDKGAVPVETSLLPGIARYAVMTEGVGSLQGRDALSKADWYWYRPENDDHPLQEVRFPKAMIGKLSSNGKKMPLAAKLMTHPPKAGKAMRGRLLRELGHVVH